MLRYEFIEFKPAQVHLHLLESNNYVTKRHYYNGSREIAFVVTFDNSSLIITLEFLEICKIPTGHRFYKDVRKK